MFYSDFEIRYVKSSGNKSMYVRIGERKVSLLNVNSIIYFIITLLIIKSLQMNATIKLHHLQRFNYLRTFL